MNAQDILAAIKALKLLNGSYIVVGGSSLALRGIRDTHDLDIIVTSELFSTLAKQLPLDPEYQRKWNRQRIKKDLIEIYPDLLLENKNTFLDIQKFIAEAEFIDNIPVQPLEHLMMCKLDTGREKDLQDVVLIQQYLKTRN